MRLAALLLLASASASAQPALFQAGPAAAPHWRVAVDGGLSGYLTAVATAEAERTVRGPFSAGLRGVVYTDSGFQDDGGGIVGSAAEAFASVGLRRRAADVRAFAGAGASAVRAYSGGLDPEFGSSEPRAIRPHVVAGVGLDLYPLPGVGFGGTLRAVASPSEAVLATASVGLRVRVAR